MFGSGRYVKSLFFDFFQGRPGEHDLGGYFEYRMFERTLCYSSTHRLMYFKVGRAASNSLIAMMTRLHFGHAAKNFTDPNELANVAWSLFPKHNNYDDINFRLFAPNIRRFTVVRNPLDRLCSFYDLLNHTREAPAPVLRLRRETDPMRHTKRIHGESVEAYLERIIELPDAKMDEHIRPQSSLLRIDQVKYDHICRFENLAADLSEMFKALELPDGYLEQFQRPMNSSNRITTSTTVPQTLRDAVRKRYQADYEAFGY